MKHYIYEQKLKKIENNIINIEKDILKLENNIRNIDDIDDIDDINLLLKSNNIWYMNGNYEDLKIWDFIVKNKTLTTWMTFGNKRQNNDIQTKLKKGRYNSMVYKNMVIIL